MVFNDKFASLLITYVDLHIGAAKAQGVNVLIDGRRKSGLKKDILIGLPGNLNGDPASVPTSYQSPDREIQVLPKTGRLGAVAMCPIRIYAITRMRIRLNA